VLKALERDPGKRFQTAGELGAALERVFPPTVPRVRTEDVGKLVMQMLGDVAEERRDALRQAIRDADARTLTDVNGDKVASDPFASTAVADPPNYARPLSDVAFSSGSGTPYGTQSPSDPPLSMAPRARGALWIAGGIGAAALAIGSAVIFTNGVQQPQAAEEPRAATSLATAAAAAPAAPPPEQHAAISPDKIELEAVPAAASAAHVAASRPKAGASRKSDSKKRESKKDPNGFVPPPVTDPGF
jgi:serine/threonine-protein kinase